MTAVRIVLDDLCRASPSGLVFGTCGSVELHVIARLIGQCFAGGCSDSPRCPADAFPCCCFDDLLECHLSHSL
eukprot:7996958-Karenia_brevis.AAC.1